MTDAAFISRFVTAQDGLRLHARDYRPGPRSNGEAADPLPVVCLPGLARTSADFDTLAIALATDKDRPRRVVALDSRGRGESDFDPDPRNYNLAVELADVIAAVTAIGIGHAVFVGTSRGGILTMLLASRRPGCIAGAVLNDIGPVIEAQGLARIKGYVGKLPPPRDFNEAALILRRLFDSQFTALTDAQWLSFAARTFKEKDGRLLPRYDPKLSATLAGIDLESPMPPLWADFDALAPAPLMVIRGANSDLLSADTVAAMRARRRDLKTLEVADQGHAPLLEDAALVDRIKTFVAGCDQAR
jgi:pimeloyl-ACP methyl ester carboxylesterase